MGIDLLDTWLPLELCERFVAMAEKRGVSEVARSDSGFMGWYRRAGGDPAKMQALFYSDKQSWFDRRNNFVKRHMAQMLANQEPLWEADGSPTRRHLALIMWAYSPDVKGLNWRLTRSGRKENPTPYIEKRVAQIITGTGLSNTSYQRRKVRDRLEYLWEQAKEIAKRKDMGDDWGYIMEIFKSSQPREWRDTI